MMLYKTIYAVRLGTCVNNFAIETAEIKREIKHLLIRIKCFTLAFFQELIGKNTFTAYMLGCSSSHVLIY